MKRRLSIILVDELTSHNFSPNDSTASSTTIKPFLFTLINETSPENPSQKENELLTKLESLCPSCLTHKNYAIEDHIRAETYCSNCGTVLSMAYPYVGGIKIDNPFSYNYYIQMNFETEPLELWAGYSRKSY